MPAIYTHYTFANDVLRGVPEELKSKLSEGRKIYELFAQSFDILFFKNRLLGTYAHNNNVNLYFKNIINCIKDNGLQDRSDVLAYLYGSITHYVLDAVVHPFVYYHTGRYYQNNKETFKYKGKHAYMEHQIDAIIYEERNKKSIKAAKFDKEVLQKVKFSKELRKVIDEAFFQTFDTVNGSRLMYKGYKNYRFVLRHVNISRLGLKYRLYKILDKWVWLKWKPSSYCYYIEKLDREVLNLERNSWCYPVDKEKVYHYTFYDLYDIATLRARKIIVALNEFFQDKETIEEVLGLIGNDSYYMGIDVEKRGQMKYFLY